VAVGDVASALTSVAAAAFLDILPGAGIEWVIHNIYHEYDVEMQFYDGTNSLIFTTVLGANVESNLQLHVNNTRRVRVKNTHGSLAKFIGYDGVQTK
jgi:hypothetical protein